MWVFNPAIRRQLSHAESGRSKKIKSTESRILELLIAKEGEVVSKQELTEHVWRDRIVTASSLTQSIAQLRIALEDSGKEQKIIKTVPKQGYMLNKGIITVENPVNEALSETVSAPPLPTENAKVATTPKRAIPPALSWVLLVLLGLLSVTLLLWLSTLLIHSLNIKEHKWLTQQYGGVQYTYQDSPTGIRLFESLKGGSNGKITRLFMSKNPDQIYVACIFHSSRFNEVGSVNLSFSSGLSSAEIKEAVNAHCQ